MDGAALAGVRRFNRLVTQRVGALQDGYLARDRSLGASRVLWEVGPEGTDVRALRARLELDSGYLSRLLRGLEADGLVRVEPGRPDRRVRTVRLTEAGQEERTLLDARSDELAAALLEPLNGRQRERLLAAMGEVECLTTAAMVEIEVRDPADPHARHCLREYEAELGRRFPDGFDPGRSISAGDDELRPPRGLVLVATLLGEPVGCGALKFHPGAPTELKRMWVANDARGLGLGRRLLAALEARAAEGPSRVLHLETNGGLTEAIALYRSAGYREVAPFNDEPYAHHWFEKRIQPAGRSAR
jgi:DNA-binding MarR family transcriptional regulator/GNAT superfamily N-acetyltransferase